MGMNGQELRNILDGLITLKYENEVFEFKEAKNQIDFRELGKYFSALSNEANLKGVSCSWLILGIEDKKHQIVGTNYKANPKDLNKLKGDIAGETTDGITFIDIHELHISEKRVIMFQIPPAPRGIPVAFQGHYYGRDGENLGALNLEELERIRKQNIEEDWSAEIIMKASEEDLDPLAIEAARVNYKKKFPDKAAEVDNWNNLTFLNKAKITIKGSITRTAIILLGKEESEHFISPSEAKIRWLLKDANGRDKDYLIVSCPLLLAVDKIYAKIRNLKYRYIKDGSLFPDEVDQYEPYTIREALNNCIAHQDYAKNSRINVVEMEDRLIFQNAGHFIPGSVEKVVIDDAPEIQYRNRFLATAMFNLRMVDTAGGGIKKMFDYQRKKFFPMPEYDLTENKVKVTIIGKVLDLQYTRLLAMNTDLSLTEIMMLDKVQKKIPLMEDEAKYLKKNKLIEGRKPNYFISKTVSQKTGQKATYTKNKAFDKKYYLDLIIKAISQHESLNRKDIDDLLLNKLPDLLTLKQKKIKVTNLIAELRRNKKIVNKGSDTKPIWTLKS